MEVEEGAMESIQAAFGETDFYVILGIEKNADRKAIKRAYRKMALKCVRADSLFTFSSRSRTRDDHDDVLDIILS